jgi:3-hydroxybutyryl-CoA dehydrogenase
MQHQVNLLGFGTMGRQIAACLDCLGYQVTVWIRGNSEDSLKRYGLDRRIFVKKMSPFMPREGGGVRFVSALADLKPALTLEVLAEELSLKRQAVSGLSYTVREADIFTNSSSYRPSEISDGMQGLHFFNPLHTLKFVETTCDPSSLRTDSPALFEDLRSIGFETIRAESNRGYIGNYILFREIGSALKLADDHGYRTQTIDAVMLKMGRSTSLFDIIDLVGTDITRRILINLKEEDASVYLSPRLDAAVKGGILGRKNNTSIRSIIDGTSAVLDLRS